MSTNIEWTKHNRTADGNPMRGETWNITVGCTRKSAGCTHCYAEQMAWRLMHIGHSKEDYKDTVKKLANGDKVWTGQVNILMDRLLDPVKQKHPTTYFVNSMSDLFHESIPFAVIDKVFAVMMLCPQHIFQVLTKRTDRMYQYCLSREDFDWIDEAAAIIVMENPHLFHVVEKMSKEAKKNSMLDFYITNQLLPHLKNMHWAWDKTYGEHGKEVDLIYEGPFPAKHIWLGTSIEDQAAADERGKPLFELHKLGWTTWVSNEPMIGPINWETPFYFGFLDWMVTGGESGSAARPMHPDWARASRDFCEKNNIPFFFKQWGQYGLSYANKGNLIWIGNEGYYTDKEPRMFSQFGRNVAKMEKTSKHDNGRLLDGKTHDGMPAFRDSQIAKQ